MSNFAYLIVDLLAVSVPLVFSFHPKLNFYKQWKYFFPAAILVAIPFLIWDEAFTAMAIWGFNTQYLLGISFFHLPLEEVLFFLCIPYACVFTHHCFVLFQFNPLSYSATAIISSVLTGLSLALASLFYNHWYTATTFSLLAITLLCLQNSHYKSLLKHFYFSYAVLLIPFFIVNGVLTGSWIANEIVWYDDLENMDIRIGTIPFEDGFYGLLLILWNVVVMEKLSKLY